MADTPPPPESAGTLSALLRSLAHTRGDAEALVYPAFVHGGQQIRRTFAELDAYVDELARGLIGYGIERGEHVAVWAPNVPDWVPLEFALARIGAVMVTVNTALKKDEVAYVLQQSRAVAVLHATRAGTNELGAMLDDLFLDGHPSVRGIRRRIWLPASPDDPAPPGLATLHTTRLKARTVEPGVLAAREAACRSDDVVNIQYTSGTTGFPKGVMLTHGNLLATATDLGDQVRTTADDRVAMMVPLFHCFGCVVCVLGAYRYGAALCAIPAFDPGDVLRLVHEERCTIIHGVPTMFGTMLRHDDLESFDTSSLRAGLAAGAPVPEPLMHEIAERLGIGGLSVAYGLTEASPGVAGSNPEDPVEVRCATIGRALPSVEIRLVDPDTGEDVPDGEAGELWARGPNVMAGYFDDPEATAAALTPDGWLRTGDRATRGDDGLYRIVGRIKELIIRGGENIAPAEIENVLRGHPDVADVAVFGVPDDRFGEEVAAAVICKPGASLDPDALVAHLADRVATFKHPKHWHAVESFPLTGSGKIRKFLLREQLAG